MITHERLKELIEKGATIWSNNHCPIKLINDGDHIIELFDKSLYVAEKFENCQHTVWWWEDYTIGFNDLYESEEDSKWVEEFACIKRTERLELPTWEEINSKLTQNSSITFFEDKKHLGFITPLKVIVINNYDTWTPNHLFLEPLTKENYTLACRKAKELFLGKQEVND